ncbi:MAG: DUF3467 domain-containing protein [Acidobacteria bacterium]|nr:DUF3467 domain-containing protein [Acidobacteriota bacterium]
MPNEPKPPQPGTIQVIAGDVVARGTYSNNMLVSHTPEEFIIDWLLNSPAGMHLVSRVIISPGHVKRVIAALTDNLQKYEMNFGSVRSIDATDQQFH